MRRCTLVVVVAALGLATVTQTSAEDICIKAKTELIGQTYIAKAMLYDTKVTVDGIRHLEWDKEAIPEGAKFQVIKMKCGTNRITLDLREIADHKTSRVEIYFLFKSSARMADDAQEKLDKIMSHVFEKPVAQEE